MNIETQIKIKNNQYLYNYLRENSKWYKDLNRHPEAIQQLEEEMKNVYKLNPSDKIEQLGRRIEMLRNFMDILN